MIHVEGLRFTYPGNRVETLRGLGFDVGPGEIFGFLGPSGAGKSTTQKILIGLLRGFSGSVRVRGRSLTPSRRYPWFPSWRSSSPASRPIRSKDSR
jgi:fluoroquinolone transport system ATP-binding protein